MPRHLRLFVITIPMGFIMGWSAMAGFDAVAQAPESDEVAVGEYDFPTDANEPLEFHVINRIGADDGAFAQGYVVVQLADGSFTGMTPCDNKSVKCQNVILPAKQALALADAGDSFPLAKETADGS